MLALTMPLQLILQVMGVNGTTVGPSTVETTTQPLSQPGLNAAHVAEEETRLIHLVTIVSGMRVENLPVASSTTMTSLLTQCALPV